MPTNPRVCSECGADISTKPAKTLTCSSAHRQQRARRLRRRAREQKNLEAQPEALNIMSGVIRDRLKDSAHEAIKENLAPVIREALTEETLKAVQRLISLTPAAVAAIEEDLAGDDPVLRQRAYTLLVKYTVGHPAIVKPDDAA